MATRSKNYKLTKIIAFILATVFTFTSGYYIYVFVKGTFFYNVYKSENFFQTNVFKSNYNRVQSDVLFYGEMYSCENAEDYFKTNEGKNILKEAKKSGKIVKNACDYLDMAEVKVSVTPDNKYRYTWHDNNGKIHYFSYDGTEIDNYAYNNLDYIEENEDSYIEDNFQTDIYETTVFIYDETQPQQNTGDASTISNKLREIWEMTGGLNYGEKTTDELVNVTIKNNSQFIPENYYRYSERFTDKNGSLQFAVFYKSIGKVYTNCGIKYTDSHEQVLKKLGGNFLEYKIGKKYYSSESERKTAPGKFFTDIDNMFEFQNQNYLKNSDDTVIERAYFSFSPQKDGFTTAKQSYDSFVQKHFLSEKYDNGQKLTHYGIAAIVTFLLACACYIYLLFVAGKNGEEIVKMNLLDRTPLAISTAVLGFIALCFVAVFVCVPLDEYEIFELFAYNDFPLSLYIYISKFSLPIVVISFTLCILTCFALLYSIVKKLRNKCLLKYTLCGVCFRLFKKTIKFLRKLAHKLVEKIKEIYIKDYEQGNGKKFYILSFLTIFTVSLINIIFIFLTAFADGGFLIFLIIINILVALYLALLVFCFDRIACGVTRIKLGSLNYNIDTRFMPPYFRALAKEISGVRDGLQTAVNQAMKDQAMKTELITNVTHDIKTPLTSIITYVDLLKRAESEEERENYLNVLEEKSLKMKKLIDDLVQASKAASGAVEVNLTKLDLGLFASQAVGEYSDEFAENDIELVLKNPENTVFVRADAKLTDRVIENLISNIKKYALKGTRAYVEVKENEGFGEIIFKNTSTAPLETDAEKLTERFYRADASRTGEGNGLGLSIARDYCIVQGGKLEIETDADLFKVKIVLPLFVD